MGIIYIITNDQTSKVYIGQTVQPLWKRWASHKQNSKIEDTHLYRAMRKYGINHFQISPLEENVPEELLDELECYYIRLYDSFNNGYNSTYGGQGKSGIRGNKNCPKEKLYNLWNQGLGIKEIAQVLELTPKTCSKWIHYYEIASEEQIVQRSQEKQSQNHYSIKILFNDIVYNSITDLANYLQSNVDKFKSKKLNTIIQGISNASKKETLYCGYSFYRI